MTGTETTKFEIPKIIEVHSLDVFEIPKNAISVGIRIADLKWPRRRIVNRLQLRLHYFLEAGGVYKDHDGEIFPIHEDSIDQTFSNDPGYKWLSDFPRRCVLETDWDYTSEKKLWGRFQILDAALRTPPFGMAI